MTYQGARARPAQSEVKRVFAVSKVRLDAAGRVTDVLWGEVNTKSNQDVGVKVVVPVADVVDAIHDGAQVAAVFPRSPSQLPQRLFEVLEHSDGRETIALSEASAADAAGQRGLRDMDKLEANSAATKAAPARPKRQRAGAANTFAVSKVALDDDGRITAVLWGRVDTSRNAWATPEVLAPVAEAVDALRAGDRVFALFPSIHGHLPDRQFVTVDYDDGRQTIVLEGPTAYEREIHDMDRLTPPPR